MFSSVPQSCPTFCDPMDCSMSGFPVHHQIPKLTQTHVHRVGDAIEQSHSLSSFFLSTFNLSQHQGLFQWVSSSYQVAKVLEFQLQHQSFQWIFRTDFLQDGLVQSCSPRVKKTLNFSLITHNPSLKNIKFLLISLFVKLLNYWNFVLEGGFYRMKLVHELPFNITSLTCRKTSSFYCWLVFC